MDQPLQISGLGPSARMRRVLPNRNAFGHALITDIAENAGDKPLQLKLPR
jgi:hypothetical protein